MIFCPECAKSQNDQLPNSNFQTNSNDQITIIKQNAGWWPVPESDLPIRLPEVEAYEPTDDGHSPLSKISEWVETTCPICGAKANRETDTMPNWAGSDWYFLRYIDPLNDMEIASLEKMKKWLPVDVYIGGDEHNTLHLLYSRFIYQFLYDLGVVPKEHPEPYYKRLSHGVILGPDNQRMSKSKGNVIVPESVADKYGVDVVRLYLMFMGPFTGTMAWNENTLMGVKRFLDRWSNYLDKQINNYSASTHEVLLIINKLIVGVTKDIEENGYNTAIAKMMEALNDLIDRGGQIAENEVRILIKLLAPMAPYITEEKWSQLGEVNSVHVAKWPEAEEKYLVEDKVVVALAVNGKVRGELEIDTQDKDNRLKVLDMAKADPKIRQWTGGKEIVREIYVEGKMVNLVIK